MRATVAYLCDGMGCKSEHKSCRGFPAKSEYCRHTTDPDHAVNGPCEHPEEHPERFAELEPGKFWEVSSGKFTDA